MVSKKVTPKDDKKGLASADQETKKKVASKGGKAKAKAKAKATSTKATSTKATSPKKNSGSAKKK